MTYYTPKALFTIYDFSEGAGNFLNIITKEVMSAQSLNGHHTVHGVTFANFAEGTRIEGKLSDIVKEAKRNVEIDAMMKRIEYRRKYISENEGEIIPQMLDKDSDYTPVYKHDTDYDNFIMIG